MQQAQPRRAEPVHSRLPAPAKGGNRAPRRRLPVRRPPGSGRRALWV